MEQKPFERLDCEKELHPVHEEAEYAVLYNWLNVIEAVEDSLLLLVGDALLTLGVVARQEPNLGVEDLLHNLRARVQRLDHRLVHSGDFVAYAVDVIEVHLSL